MSPGHRFAMMFLVPVFSWAAPAEVSAAAQADSLVVTDCSYGEVYQFASAGCTASLENNGSVPLTLSIVPVQPGNTVEPSGLTLAAHAKADLHLHVLTDNIAGTVTWSYRIEGGKELHFARAAGFVNSVLDAGHPHIDFGSLAPSALPATETIALRSSIDSTMRITKILSSPPMLHAHIGPDAKSLTVDVRRDAPWGPFDGMVKLAIDTPQQKQVWVQVTGSVPGDIGPSTNPQWLGEVPWQADRTLTVPLVDREGHDFTVGAVRSNDFAATYDNAPCEPARNGCRNLVIHVSDAQPAGLFKSNIDVALTDRKKHLNVGIWGALGERPQPGQTVVAPTITKAPVALPQTGDLVSVAPPLKVQPDPPGTGPLLKWTIAQQASVHGYQVFRADAADGPFMLMEPHIIPTDDNGKGPVAYRWRDTTAVKGKTYWYYIAVIYSSGDRASLSGPQKTLAK